VEARHVDGKASILLIKLPFVVSYTYVRTVCSSIDDGFLANLAKLINNECNR